MKKFTPAQGIAATAIACVLVAIASYVVVAANTSHTMVSASRSGVYASLEELRSDSDQVVVATVTDSKEFLDGEIPSTEFELTVSAQSASAEARAPQQISVVQIGSLDTAPKDEDYYLRVGTTYLLYLRNSNAAKTLNPPYYISGLWVGIYRASGEDRFAQLFDRADILPATLSAGTPSSKVLGLPLGTPTRVHRS